MTTNIEYALLAAASYFDTRASINRISAPADWTEIDRKPSDALSRFEAAAFQSSSEIVISYAGTDPSQLSSMSGDKGAIYSAAVCAYEKKAADRNDEVNRSHIGKEPFHRPNILSLVRCDESRAANATNYRCAA